MRLVFLFAPVAVWALMFPLHVLTCGFRFRTKVVWAFALLAAFSKFICFRLFGGDSFVPELPGSLVLFWDVAFFAALALFGFELVLAPLSLALRKLRRPLSGWVRSVAAPVLAMAIALAGVWQGVRLPRVHEVGLAFASLPESLAGYRILLISDLHASSLLRRPYVEEVVRLANAQRADLVVVTGDLVDGKTAFNCDRIEPIRDLTARDGVFFVTGNHEYYFDRAGWRKLFADWKLRFLHDEWANPRDGLAVVGIDDLVRARFGESSPDLTLATNGIPEKAFVVLLQHRPGEAAGNLADGRISLQLSGHTHGGVAPGLARLVAGFNGGFVRGAYRLGDGWLYVSPGSGQWAGFPYRFFNDSELTVIRLERGQPAGAQAVGGNS